MLESIFLAPYQFSLPVPGVEFEQKQLMSRYKNYALIGSLLQDESVGTVVLGGPLGALLDYSLSEGDSKMMVEGMKSAAEVLFAAGATRVITSHRKTTILQSTGDLGIIDARGVAPGAISVGSAHPQGGNRMGGAGMEGSSVVDSDSKVHGFENLFVCDASVFPTSLGVNPQLTVMALASRLGEHLAEGWSAFPK
jgi:choline dehydrogenase-like flavoprotein